MALPVADLIVENGPIWCGATMASSRPPRSGRATSSRPGPSRHRVTGRARHRPDRSPRSPRHPRPQRHPSDLVGSVTWAGSMRTPAAAPTLATLLARIGERARALGPGKWVLARGYDQTKLDVLRHPLRDELDRAAPDNPVVLIRTCGHISIASSKALALAAIDERRPCRRAASSSSATAGSPAYSPRMRDPRRPRRCRRRTRTNSSTPSSAAASTCCPSASRVAWMPPLRPSRRLRRDRRLSQGQAHRPLARPHLAHPARRSRRRHRRQGARRRHGLRHRRRHADDRRGQDLPRRLSRRPHRLDVEALPRCRRDLRRCHAARQRAHRPRAGLSRQGLPARLPRHRRRGDRAADRRLREGARRNARSRPPASHRALRILDAGPPPAHARRRHLSLPAAGVRLRLRRRLCGALVLGEERGA